MIRILVTWIIVLLLSSCSRSPSSGRQDWGAELLAKHAEVDRLLERGDTKGARRTLLDVEKRLQRTQRPSTDGKLLQEARKDTYFRLARLDLEEKNFETALRHCEAGLQLGSDEDLFTANLLALRGTIRQELGQNLTAAEDFHQALLINESLLKRALEP
jgi:tetratricopeptide (TPR) repeat protein